MGLASALFYAGILLIFVGIVGFVAYTLLLAARGRRGEGETGEGGGGSVEGGGVIFIGPIPIVFGSNRRVAKWMFIAAIIITVVLVLETLFVLGVI